MAGKELGADSKEDVKVAPAQATPPPQWLRQHWADLLSNANFNTNTTLGVHTPLAATSQAY